MSFLLPLFFVSLCWTQEAIKLDLYLTEKERLTAQLEAQRLKLEKTERDFKRYEELYNRGFLSKSEYEDWKNRI